MTARNDKEANFRTCKQLVTEAASQDRRFPSIRKSAHKALCPGPVVLSKGCQLVALPECFAFIGAKAGEARARAGEASLLLGQFCASLSGGAGGGRAAVRAHHGPPLAFQGLLLASALPGAGRYESFGEGDAVSEFPPRWKPESSFACQGYAALAKEQQVWLSLGGVWIDREAPKFRGCATFRRLPREGGGRTRDLVAAEQRSSFGFRVSSWRPGQQDFKHSRDPQL